MTWARLAISDGTTTIDLLASMTGYHLKSWKPAVAQYKDDGVYHSNPWADGRRLVMRRFDNTVESMVLGANDNDEDDLIAKEQKLRRLLEAAADYWEDDYNSTPVYIIARAARETHTRYAVIVHGTIPEENNPYAPPFFNDVGSAMDELSLVIERKHWQSTIPGTTDCVQVSALQSTDGSATVISGFSPTQSADDAYIILGTSIDLTSVDMRVGQTAVGAIEDLGVRFRAVTIPAGATITRAYITLTASENFGSATVIGTRIFGIRDSTPAIFSTLDDFVTRDITTNMVDWDFYTTAAATACNSPDISSIIQEIINLAGWASGNDLAIMMVGRPTPTGTQDARFDTFDHAANLPTLTVEYISATPDEFGRGATCTAEVYVSNKHMRTQLTHAYHYDAAPVTWSANLIGAALPVALLPAVPAIGDCLYLGSTTAISSSGSFSSLVLDLLGGYAPWSGHWEYYDSGTGWAPIDIPIASIPRDNTLKLSATGVASLHWIPPATWTTVAVNGVTGWWFRFICTAAAGAPPPYQQNRDIYTVNTPFVTAAASQVAGDIRALDTLVVHCRSGFPGTVSLTGHIRNAHRVIVGSRATSRGTGFTPCVNLSDVQNAIGISITAGYKTVFASDVSVPTGRKLVFTATGVEALVPRATAYFSYSICSQYYGRFRVIGIVKAGAYSLWTLAVSLKAITTSSSSVVFTSEEMTLNNTTFPQLVDFGTLTMPPVNSLPITPYQTGIELRVASTGAGALNLMALWLMPVDEWSGEFIETADRGTSLSIYDALVIDSARVPKQQLQAYIMREYYTGAGYQWLSQIDWQCVAGYPFTLKANAEQKLWFLCAYADASFPNVWRYDPNMVHVVQLFKAQRYLSMRGAR